jgi:hypothetical protein
MRKKATVAWSNKVEKKVKRKIKREKKEIVEKKRKNEAVEEDDYNTIQDDFKILKKLKKKKVSFLQTIFNHISEIINSFF